VMLPHMVGACNALFSRKSLAVDTAAFWFFCGKEWIHKHESLKGVVDTYNNAEVPVHLFCRRALRSKFFSNFAARRTKNLV
jgi:hypothetical protein